MFPSGNIVPEDLKINEKVPAWELLRGVYLEAEKVIERVHCRKKMLPPHEMRPPGYTPSVNQE